MTRSSTSLQSYSFISAFSCADDGYFLIVIPINFQFLPDLIGCHPTVKFKPIIFTAIILFLASVRAVTWLLSMFTVFWTDLTQPSVVCMFLTSIRSVSLGSVGVRHRSSPKVGNFAIYDKIYIPLEADWLTVRIKRAFMQYKPQFPLRAS